MAYPEAAPTRAELDLTTPPPLAREVRSLQDFGVDRETLRSLDALGGEENPGERLHALDQFLERLDEVGTAELVTAAGKASLAFHRPAVRVLFSLLDVKRPGVEVLHQLELLSSLERVSLGLISGKWTEPGEGEHGSAVYSVLEVLEEGTKVGLLDLGIEALPRRPVAVRALFSHLRRWFSGTAAAMARGNRPPEAQLRFLTQLGMVEIALLEKRLSRLAGSIDPYDSRWIARLLPVLSRHDQDIVHLKDVMLRLATYEPFSERLLTLEHRLSPEEFARVVDRLLRSPAGSAPGRVLDALRGNPVLSRRLSARVSVAHQTAVLRARKLPTEPRPDPLSTLLRVIESDDGGDELLLRLEPDVADVVWPLLETWGMRREAPDLLAISIADERALDFVEMDGAPRLPHQPEPREERKLDLKELVRSQLANDPFLLGILENSKATSVPGVVEIIALHTRSLRVLDKICRTASLYSGAANKNVPSLLLQNPSRIPLQEVRRFINVRYVSKVDLRHLSRNHAALRPEVWRELDRYLATLKI